MLKPFPAKYTRNACEAYAHSAGYGTQACDALWRCIARLIEVGMTEDDAAVFIRNGFSADGIVAGAAANTGGSGGGGGGALQSPAKPSKSANP